MHSLIPQATQLGCTHAAPKLLQACQAAGITRRWRRKHCPELATALLSMAYHSWDWIRDPKGWRPVGHRCVVGSLAAHLFAEYRPPAFMDRAWLLSLWDCQWERALACQSLYRHLGCGGSPQTAPDLPMAMARGMGRHFLGAPNELTIGHALRWGQLVHMGASRSVARAILGTRAADPFSTQGRSLFWSSVWRFFLRSPGLLPVHYGPVVDYLFDKLELQPNMSMKGRTVESLLGQVERWHGALGDLTRPVTRWARSGIRGLRLTGAEGPERVVWTIHELLSSQELAQEGGALRHCVYLYLHDCSGGGELDLVAASPGFAGAPAPVDDRGLEQLAGDLGGPWSLQPLAHERRAGEDRALGPTGGSGFGGLCLLVPSDDSPR